MKNLKAWVKRCEELIVKHSTPPRTRGKYKGHGSTNDVAWVCELTAEVSAAIKKSHKGSIAYDENMAIASSVGLILSTWYCLVHRAKSYDENRPTINRRKANRKVTQFKSLLNYSINDDALMGSVWNGQKFAVPYGRGVKSGKFV